MAIRPTGRAASHCVLLDPFKDACAIDHGAVRAGCPQNLVMVAVEVAGMEQSGFPTVESSGGQFAAGGRRRTWCSLASIRPNSER
jgi:hypothetical protein